MPAIKLIQSDDGQLLYKPCEVEEEDQMAQPISAEELVQSLPALFEQARGYEMESSEGEGLEDEQEPQMEGEQGLMDHFSQGFKGVRGGDGY